MKQEFNKYTEEDRKVWSTLFERQMNNLQDKACEDYLTCLTEMKDVLHPNNVPNFNEINEWYTSSTGWSIEVVPGLIPVEEFFILLAQKKFCSSTWLRSWSELDYLEEPDMFHDIFGHIPLLANPTYSKFMHAFGEVGAQSIGNAQTIIELQRLYWFTIEFGLMQNDVGKRVYGAGILSSFGETNSSLSDKMIVHDYSIKEIINKEFITTEPQSEYFALDSFETLFESLSNFKTIKNELV